VPVLDLIKEADYLARKILRESGHMQSLSQMPVVLIPVHFDRDPFSRVPSCQRSVVIRTFITNDFMTGIPATIGKEIPEEVSIVCSCLQMFSLQENKNWFHTCMNVEFHNHHELLYFKVVLEMAKQIKTVPGISRVLYDLTPKPPGTTEWE
jgi:GMP synthase (glutamine-hydrolysing)